VDLAAAAAVLLHLRSQAAALPTWVAAPVRQPLLLRLALPAMVAVVAAVVVDLRSQSLPVLLDLQVEAVAKVSREILMPTTTRTVVLH